VLQIRVNTILPDVLLVNVVDTQIQEPARCCQQERPTSSRISKFDPRKHGFPTFSIKNS
jgi:hypothetical protein